MDKKGLLQLCAIISIGIIAFGIILVFEIPDTPKSAHEYAESHYERTDDTYYYNCPLDKSGLIYGWGIITVDIEKSDFDNEIHNRQLRFNTLDCGCGNFIDPDNRYVKMIADVLSEKTEGYSEREKAKCVMYFVDRNIPYQTDMQTYGMEEYWATPTETLYMRTGDCEDRSILACSILIAMGLDGALLDYPDHVAPAIRYEGDYGYRSADFCYEYPYYRIDRDGVYPNIYNDIYIQHKIIRNIIGTYRYGISEIFGI